MEQGNIRTCAYCRQDKAWIWGGKKLKDGSKVYTDENGLRWSGRRCPECERSRVYAAVRCDSFERDIIVRQFEDAGYEIVSKTLPLQVAKDGRTYTVGIKRAFTSDGRSARSPGTGSTYGNSSRIVVNFGLFWPFTMPNTSYPLPWRNSARSSRPACRRVDPCSCAGQRIPGRRRKVRSLTAATLRRPPI